MEFAYNEADVLSGATVGEVVIESKSYWDGCSVLYDEDESYIEDEQQFPSPESAQYSEDWCQNSDNIQESSDFYDGKRVVDCGAASFQSVVHVQRRLPIATGLTLPIESKPACIERRVIVIQAGNDPEQETSLAVAQITEELNQKAAAAMSAGIMPEAETVIEITTVMESADQQPEHLQSNQIVIQNGNQVLGVGRENIPPCNTSVHASAKLSSVALRTDEYQTPSPLVPAFDRRPVAVEQLTPDQNCEDFYFRPLSVDFSANRRTPTASPETVDTSASLTKSVSRLSSRFVPLHARGSHPPNINNVFTLVKNSGNLPCSAARGVSGQKKELIVEGLFKMMFSLLIYIVFIGMLVEHVFPVL